MPALKRVAAGLVFLALAPCVHAQPAPGSAPAYAFATPAQGRAVLGARDDYVRATTPLERAAKTRSADTVDETRFRTYMEDAVQRWPEDEQRALKPLFDRLAEFVARVRWKHPDRILLVKTDASLEDDSPHTRAAAIMLPGSVLARPPGFLQYLAAHETFHVLTRNNPELKEKLYAAIGFKRCETVTLPPGIDKLRITNPDAVENRHTIVVRYRGETVEALPWIRFRSTRVDTQAGFMNAVQIAWLLVDRQGGECRVRGGALESGVPPEQFEGLYEQIGRNTQYLFHPEEILADNFALLYLTAERGAAPKIPSPEVLDRMRKILFE